MSRIICFDIYPSARNNLKNMDKQLKRYGFIEKSNKYGVYYHGEVSKWDAFCVMNLIRVHNYKFKKYDKCWARGDNYRSEFFKHNRGPYRCAYCGRRITAQQLEVDHLVPVAGAQRSGWARFWLNINAIYNVNNYRNLVAACHRCNQNKSDKMGLWVVIGSIGKHKWFWNIIDFVVLVLIIGGVLIAAQMMGHLAPFIENIRELVLNWL